jgi:hypothetical protein
MGIISKYQAQANFREEESSGGIAWKNNWREAMQLFEPIVEKIDAQKSLEEEKGHAKQMAEHGEAAGAFLHSPNIRSKKVGLEETIGIIWKDIHDLENRAERISRQAHIAILMAKIKKEIKSKE